MTGLTARLGAELTDAGRSVLRLLRFDPLWAEGLDLSADGFLRSFLGPLLALPLNLIVIHVWSQQPGAQSQPLFAAGVSHIVDAVAYPALLALVARPTGIDRGYAAFVILVNWTSLFLYVGLAALALPLLAIGHAEEPFRFFAFVVYVLSLFALWRAARETVGRSEDGVRPLGPVLMVVVLAVGVGALADQAGAWLVS